MTPSQLILYTISILSSITFSARRLIRQDDIDCKGFKTQQCLDLAHQYYGLTPTEIAGYGYMQQAILADSIKCHYIYDVCPFFIPNITGLSEPRECIDNQVEFTDENGETAYYECNDVNLYSFIPIEELGSNNNASGADIWGYQTLDDEGNVEKHYAITCQADGSTIVDITDPLNPNVLAFILSNVNNSLGPTNISNPQVVRNVLWRDVKVYKEHAIVVADTGGRNDHGIQIFNLTKIIQDATVFQGQTGSEGLIYNVPLEDIVIYNQVGRCHNVYVDNDIGHLYAFGSMGINGNDCRTGIHIVDINDPNTPTFMGCYDGAQYVHDAQCVLYHGPDRDYRGREICFMFTPDVGNLTIVDVTDKENIYEISSTTYFTSSYNHQGWITSNHEYLLLDDETDEGPLPERFPKTQNFTTTYIFDIRDLDNVDYRRPHRSDVLAVDHNQYIVDNGHLYSSNSDLYRGYTFQANYEAGLRILDISDIANEFGNELEEIAYFDMYPWKFNSNGSSVYDEIKFFGAWSSYPYFNKLGTNPDDYLYSNKIIVQSTTTGLYVLEFTGDMNFNGTAFPTMDPTYDPTNEPTGPTQNPTDNPTNEPTQEPTSPPTLEPTTSEPTMEPTVDVGEGGSENDFEWDSWYGITLIIVIIILALLAIFLIFKLIMHKRRNRKKGGVYESIIGMERGSSSQRNYGTTADQRM